MNYLAHAFLSFNQPDILAGNILSDFIKGKKKFDYSPGVQRGITLHRAIDEFTDNHTVTKKAKTVFQPAYGLYSGVFMDVVYDHFLATDTTYFNDESLLEFAKTTYAALDLFEQVFPPAFKMIFPYMKKYDWLYNYKSLEGIQRSFEGIVHRALYMSESKTAFTLFKENYIELQSHYQEFFPELKLFAFDTLRKV